MYVCGMKESKQMTLRHLKTHLNFHIQSCIQSWFYCYMFAVMPEILQSPSQTKFRDYLQSCIHCAFSSPLCHFFMLKISPLCIHKVPIMLKVTQYMHFFVKYFCKNITGCTKEKELCLLEKVLLTFCCVGEDANLCMLQFSYIRILVT